MRSEIIIIGDEILIGQVIDTNSAFLGKKLAELGAPVSKITKIGDEESDIVQTFKEVSSRADFIITCGGLGPTNDDRTRFAVAKCLNSELKINPSALTELESYYKKSNRILSESNHVQVMIPDEAEYLSNQRGTAPGLKFKLGKADFFCLQGVPKEMEWMSETYVFPHVLSVNQNRSVVRYSLIRTTGVPESSLYEKIRTLVQEYDKILEIAFLPQMSRGVDLRLTIRDHSESESLSILSNAEIKFKDIIHHHFPYSIYAIGEKSFDEMLAGLFFEHNITIATAESCTGGYIAHRLTNVSGSSKFFMRGVVVYSNRSKTELLDIQPELIDKFGAVSMEVASRMAENIRIKSNTTYGLATTGIAGPTGATETKPIGLAYIGLSDAESTKVFQLPLLPFALDRISFKERLTIYALDQVRKKILEQKNG